MGGPPMGPPPGGGGSKNPALVIVLIVLVVGAVIGGAILLTNTRATTTGNVNIVDNVATTTFAVDGMGGGQGGQCAAAAPCKVNEECRSNQCVLGVCTAP